MKPNKYNSTSLRVLASIEARRAKDGTILFNVEAFHSLDKGMLNFSFKHLSSAMDFIETNVNYV